MKILYFTGTGNSLYVAKELGGEALSIPKMMKEERFDFTDEKIGIVFPLYAWSVPPYLVDFMKKATFHCEYLFAVTTYGFYSGGIASHVLDIGKEAGHNFSYINRIRMVDNFLPTFNMAREIKNESRKDIDRHIAEIKHDIEESREFSLKESGFKKLSTKWMANSIVKPFNTGRYKLADGCTACGTCASVCPIDNILVDKEEKFISFKEPCIGCFACIQNCPQKVIHLKGEVSSERFRNQHISLKEIIEANS